MQRALAACLLAGLVLVPAGVAAVQWTTHSTLRVEAQPAPALFEAGPGASRERFVGGFETSPGRTSFSASFTAHPGADTRVRDVVRVVGNASGVASVRLEGSRVDAASFCGFTWTLRGQDGNVGSLDHASSRPEVSFQVPPGQRVALDLRVCVHENARGAPVPFTVRLVAT